MHQRLCQELPTHHTRSLHQMRRSLRQMRRSLHQMRSSAQIAASGACITAPSAQITAPDALIAAPDAPITARFTAPGAQIRASGAQIPATVAPYQKDQKNQKRIRAACCPAAAVPVDHHPGEDQPEPGTTDHRPVSGRAHAAVMPAARPARTGTDLESAARPSGQDPG